MEHVMDKGDACWLAIADLDDFKQINDSYGLTVGIMSSGLWQGCFGTAAKARRFAGGAARNS